MGGDLDALIKKGGVLEKIQGPLVHPPEQNKLLPGKDAHEARLHGQTWGAGRATTRPPLEGSQAKAPATP